MQIKNYEKKIKYIQDQYCEKKRAENMLRNKIVA